MQRRREWILGALIVGAIVAGLALYVAASDETKQSELGAGLISTGAFGILLLFFEIGLTRETADIRETLAVSAAPLPAEDHDRLAPPPAADVQRDRFSAVYDGWQRDTSRLDASQARFRVWKGDEYFQFFVAVVSNISLRVALHGATNITIGQFRRAFAEMAVELIRHSIASGEAPLEEDRRTIAIELFPDADEAARIARGIQDREYQEGDVIATFPDPRPHNG